MYLTLKFRHVGLIVIVNINIFVVRCMYNQCVCFLVCLPRPSALPFTVMHVIREALIKIYLRGEVTEPFYCITVSKMSSDNDLNAGEED